MHARLRGDGCILQDVIEAWHQQEALHALLLAPECLVLQLGRFWQNDAGDICKLRHRVSLDVRTFQAPVFDLNDLTIKWQSYGVSSAVIHMGETIHSGHYKNMLYDERLQCWLADDGETASRSSWSDMQLTQTECYLLFCNKLM